MVLPLAVMQAVCGSICGFIIHRTGRYITMIRVGTMLHLLGLGLFIVCDANTSIGEIIGLQFILGTGSGVLFNPPLIALQALTPQNDTAMATSTFAFLRNLATCFSIVAGGVLFQNSMALRKPDLQAAGISSTLLDELSGSSAAANVKIVGKLKGAQRVAAKDAYAWSMRNLWIMYCVMAGCSVVASFFIKKQVLKTEHTETKTGLAVKEKESTSNTAVGNELATEHIPMS